MGSEMPREFNWKRRTAMHIASMLPEDPEDAQTVLNYVLEMAADMERPDASGEPGQVLSFPLAASIFRAKS